MGRLYIAEIVYFKLFLQISFCILLMSETEPSEASVNRKKEADASPIIVLKEKETGTNLQTPYTQRPSAFPKPGIQSLPKLK